jgi:transposase
MVEIKKNNGKQCNLKDYLHIEQNSNKTVKTYSQDWAAYNQAQTQEKILFLELLYELTSQIPQPKRKGPGRPKTNIGGMIFCCCMKTYLNFSSRRTASDLQLAKHLGYIDSVPHFNTTLKYLKEPLLKDVLKKTIELSSLPLKQIEENFTVDASGFSTSMFSRWYGIKQKHEERRLFRKAHVMSGVKTNIITSIEITDGYVHDSLMFSKLVSQTSQHFQMKEVSADKGYSSRQNLGIVSKHGAIPFIPFKINATGKAKGFAIWKAMYRYYHNHKEEFLKHYHRRSNAETVFSMIKRKQGNHLRMKTEVAQTNEILCKALVHNICVLIQEMFEAGIIIDFQEIAQDEFMCKIYSA